MTEEYSSQIVEDFQERIHKLKKWEAWTVCGLLAAWFISFLVIVIIQIKSKTADYEKVATILSAYTSIVLGFVAMAVSLLGMKLSFHNTIQAEEGNLTAVKQFSNIEHSIERLNDMEKNIEKQLIQLKEKTVDMQNKMEQFQTLKSQLSDVSEGILCLSKELQMQFDKYKGAGSDDTETVTTTPQVAKDMKTDEYKNV